MMEPIPENPVRKWGIELEAGWGVEKGKASRPASCVIICDIVHRRHAQETHNLHHNSRTFSSNRLSYCTIHGINFVREICPNSGLPSNGDTGNRQKILNGIRGKLKCRWQIGTDGSIHTEDSIPAELRNVPPATRLPSLKSDIELLINERVKEVNQTMGSHIHVSFGKRDVEFYKNLLSWEFVEYFQSTIKNSKLVEVKKRFSNRFCSEYTSKNNLRDSYASHRKCINFPYGEHGSIEFRVFPMQKDPHRIIYYIDFIEDVIRDFMIMITNKDIEPETFYNPYYIAPRWKH